MPYKNISDLPKAFDSLSDAQKKVALKALNKMLAEGKKEEEAIPMAVSAAKKMKTQMDKSGGNNMGEGDLPTEDFEGVELARVGNFTDMHGKKVSLTRERFDRLVANMKKLAEVVKAPIRLGHNEEQNLLADDGLPAAGWVANYRRDGDTLLADFKRVPSQVAKLIRAGAYRTRSVGILPKFEHQGELFEDVMHHVALLGAATPAIKGLGDILALYSLPDEGTEDLTVIVMGEKDGPGDRKTKTNGNAKGEEVDLMDPKELAKLLELSEEATEDEVKAAIIGLKEKTKQPEPDADGKVLLAEDELTQLRDDAAAGRKASEELTKMRIEGKVDAGIRAGKIYPSERTEMIAFATSAPDSFDAWLGKAPRKLKAGEEIGNGGNEAPFELPEAEISGMKAAGIDEATYIKVNYPDEHARREAAKK